MTQHRRAEVNVRCDVPGCLMVWQYVGEREHAYGRPSGEWLYVHLSKSVGPHREFDFCPQHAGTKEALHVIGAALHQSAARGTEMEEK